jgi:S-adenosylmethionine hydrolase
VFFLTDYGYADEFAGVVRAVISRHAPEAPVVDLTHGVEPFDVRAGALALRRAVPHVGPGVVLAVVDPGVGGGRRSVALSVRTGRDERVPHAFVGPDNGLLPWAVDALGGIEEAVALPAPDAGATTFDGRDVFAAATARLWDRVPLDDLGARVDPHTLVRLAAPRCQVTPDELEAEVQWVDRFGNVQLAARAEDARRAGLIADGHEHEHEHERDVEVAGSVTARARVVGSFGELSPGALGVVIDANDHLALVCDRASAATVLGVQSGDVLVLRPRLEGPV